MDKKQLQEELKAELDHMFGESDDHFELAIDLSEIEPMTAAAITGAGVVGLAQQQAARKQCKEFKGDKSKWSRCIRAATWSLTRKSRDKKMAALRKNESENLSEIDPIVGGGVALAGGAMVASRVMARRRCKAKFPDMKSDQYKACFKNELTLGQKKKFRDQDESSAEEIALYEDILSEIDPVVGGGVALAGGAMVASRVMARRRCRKKFPDMKSDQYKACFKNELTLGQKKKFRDQDESSIIRNYAVFYVSENDDFDMKKKLDMLAFIEKADDSMIADLFENGEIEAPPAFLFMTEEQATEMMEKASELLMSEESASMTAGKQMLKTAKDYWKQKGVEAGEKLHKASQHVPGGVEGMQGIAVATAAAAALTAGVMAYRKHWSKAARACKGAEDQAACKNKFKAQAIAAKIAAMKAGKAKCSKTKDPKKCAAKIDNKIKAAQAKAA